MTIEIDHTNEYTLTGRGSNDDMPGYMTEINWNPYWGGFYYFSYSNFWLIRDTNADTTDACDANQCDQNLVPNYCARDTKLFEGTGNFEITSVNIISSAGNQGWDKYLSSQAMAFDSVFMVLSHSKKKISRIKYLFTETF